MTARYAMLLCQVVAAALASGMGGIAAMAAETAPCGLSPSDWCRSPPGDPCGRHANERACRSDPACVGMPYRGEAVIACVPDGRLLEQLPGGRMRQPADRQPAEPLAATTTVAAETNHLWTESPARGKVTCNRPALGECHGLSPHPGGTVVDPCWRRDRRGRPGVAGAG